MAAILKIVKSPYIHKKIIRFWWNLVHSSTFVTRCLSCDQIQNFL